MEIIFKYFNNKSVENNNLLELIFEPETVEYLKKSGYTIESGNIHKHTLAIMLTKNSDSKRKIVSDLITKCYWDDNFLDIKEITENIILGGVTHKKSYKYNILYFLLHHSYPESIILKVLESNKVDLDIYDKYSNTLIHNVICKKKYPNVFIKLLELCDSDIINKKNDKGLSCWDIALQITDFDFYLEKIIACGKFNFDEEFIKNKFEIIKNYCECKNINDNQKSCDIEYKYLYKIFDFTKDLNLLNNYWYFYYDISLVYYFEDIYQIVCVNRKKLEIILNFIKFIGWYYNFDKNFEIDLELFDSIDDYFMSSFLLKKINHQDFYSGIQYILKNNDCDELVKSKNYIEAHLDCKFFISNIEDMKNIYKDYFGHFVLLKSFFTTDDDDYCNKLIYLVLFNSLKNNINIDILKTYIRKILVKFKIDCKTCNNLFKINYNSGEINRENELIPYLIHNYNCDEELITMYVGLGFFKHRYNFKPVNNDLFCKMIELNMYDKVYLIINDLNLDYYYYFFKPSVDILSIFEYYLSVRNTVKSYDIIQKTGPIIFNYISFHNFNESNKICEKFYKLSKKKFNKDTTYPNDSALYWACKNNMSNIAAFLLDNCLSDPNYMDSDGKNVLIWSCINSMESIGLRLLDIENIDTTKLDSTYKSALNYAVENGLEKISAKLIQILINLLENQKK